MAELKPCPFCGGKPTLCVCDGSGKYWTKDLSAEKCWGREMTHCKVICFKCGIETKAYLTRRGLFNAWNRRADANSLTEALKRNTTKIEEKANGIYAEYIRHLQEENKALDEKLASLRNEVDAEIKGR